MCSSAKNTLSLFSQQEVSTFPTTLLQVFELGTCSGEALNNLITGNYSLQNSKGNILVYGLCIVRQKCSTQIHFQQNLKQGKA